MITIEPLIVSLLRNDAQLSARIDGRVFADVADSDTFPFLSYAVISAEPRKHLTAEETRWALTIQISVHAQSANDRAVISRGVHRVLSGAAGASDSHAVLKWCRLADVYDVQTNISPRTFTRAMTFSVVADEV